MLPELNPISAPEAYCTMCGEKMKMTLERGPRNRVEKIVYSCVNPETGCNYKIDHDQRLTGMATKAQ